MLLRVILAVDEPALERDLRRLMARPDLVVHAPRRRGPLLEVVGREPCDLYVVSHSLIPEPVPEAIRLVRQLPEAPAVVVLSGSDDAEERARFLAAGCDAVLYHRLSGEMLWAVLSTILDKRRSVAEERLNRGQALARARLTDFVSSSPAMQAFMAVVRRVVVTDCSLLLLGETGVGKERLARAIHAEGPRGQGPFVTVNCGGLPETLLESELFGHEEGAFTGATRSRRGMFELAHRGTILLDEVGEMPYHLQVKLLRALQEHEIQRVGGECAILVDVRVMAATNRDLAAEVEAGRFRKDLYYRLGVVTLTIPPLRERREDIPALIDSYLDYLCPRIGRPGIGITDEARQALCLYSWPGNVRELINVLERAILLGSGDAVASDDLPQSISRLSPPAGEPGDLARAGPALRRGWIEEPLREVRRRVVGDFERAYLAEMLRATEGRVGEAARRAGIDPRSLYGKMKRCGLCKEDFRPSRQGS